MACSNLGLLGLCCMLYLLSFAAGGFYLGFGRSREFIRFNCQRTVDFAVSQDFNRVDQSL